MVCSHYTPLLLYLVLHNFHSGHICFPLCCTFFSFSSCLLHNFYYIQTRVPMDSTWSLVDNLGHCKIRPWWMVQDKVCPLLQLPLCTLTAWIFVVSDKFCTWFWCLHHKSDYILSILTSQTIQDLADMDYHYRILSLLIGLGHRLRLF